jgi:MATE family multidrug resistance protein
MLHSIRTLFLRHKANTRQLIVLVLPILAAHLVGVIIPFMNTLLAGRYSPTALAATGLAGTTFSAVMGFGWGILTSVGIITANQLGQTHEIAKTGAILKASLFTALIISAPIMVLLKYMHPLWIWCGQTPEIATLGQNYLDGLIWLVLVDFIKFSIFQFTIAHHRVAAPIISTLLSIPLTWFLNAWLVPKWGLYGLSAGTALIYWLSVILLWIYLYKDRFFSQCLSFKFSWETYFILCKRQFALGIPMGLMSSIELLFFVIIGLWMGRISTEHLVAHQIALQWLGFAIIAAMSFSEAVTILVAKARSVRTTSAFVWLGVWLTGVFMTLFSCLYWFAPRLIIDWDLATNEINPRIISLTTVTLALCGVFQIFDGIRIVFSGALRGLSDTQYPMWVTLIAFWGIGLPAAYGAAFILKWENTGLWLGMTAAVIVMIGLQYYRMRQQLFSKH